MRMTTTAVMIGTLAFAAAAPVFASDSEERATAQRVLQHQPAISSVETGAINRVTLAEGKNSFTESQARTRIEGAGFTHIGALVLDQYGIWRGTANKGAMTVDVGLDFKGSIAADNARAQ